MYVSIDGDDVKEKFREFLLDASANPKEYGIDKCCLCSGETDRIGVFAPNPEFAKRIGEPAGKVRTVLYGLCRVHFNHPERDSLVEQYILKRFQVS